MIIFFSDRIRAALDPHAKPEGGDESRVREHHTIDWTVIRTILDMVIRISISGAST